MTHTLLILGAGPGTGQAMAPKYAAEGWNIALVARRAETLATIAESIRSAPVIPGNQCRAAHPRRSCTQRCRRSPLRQRCEFHQGPNGRERSRSELGGNSEPPPDAPR